MAASHKVIVRSQDVLQSGWECDKAITQRNGSIRPLTTQRLRRESNLQGQLLQYSHRIQS